jgi:hypothetical protein
MVLFQTRAWSSNITCHGICYVQWFVVRGDCSVFSISGIVAHHCLEMVFPFVDIGGIVDYLSLILFMFYYHYHILWFYFGC